MNAILPCLIDIFYFILDTENHDVGCGGWPAGRVSHSTQQICYQPGIPHIQTRPEIDGYRGVSFVQILQYLLWKMRFRKHFRYWYVLVRVRLIYLWLKHKNCTAPISLQGRSHRLKGIPRGSRIFLFWLQMQKRVIFHIHDDLKSHQLHIDDFE